MIYFSILRISKYFENNHKPKKISVSTEKRRHKPVGIATRYGLDSPVIELRCGQIFGLRPDQFCYSNPSYKWGTVSFSGVKRPGFVLDHTTPSRTEVKIRVFLYF
jgi:hypothetical protein